MYLALLHQRRVPSQDRSLCHRKTTKTQPELFFFRQEKTREAGSSSDFLTTLRRSFSTDGAGLIAVRCGALPLLVQTAAVSFVRIDSSDVFVPVCGGVLTESGSILSGGGGGGGVAVSGKRIQRILERCRGIDVLRTFRWTCVF